MQNPFEKKEVYKDTPLDNGIIWVFSKLLKQQLGSGLAGEPLRLAA